MDPIFSLSDHEMLVLSADLQVQLEKGTGTRPVLWLLAHARTKAAKAFVLFMDADADDTKLIRRLQAEVKIYDDMVLACREMLNRGKDADRKIRESDRLALDEVTAQMSDEEMRMNGIEQRGQD